MRDATTTDLLARLEALSAGLDEQAGRIAGLVAENAHLRATLGVPATPDEAGPRVGRRGMLRTVLGASAAAACLAQLAGPSRADAAHDGTAPYDPNTVLHVDVINTTANRTSWR